MSQKLYVGGLPYSVTDGQLEEIFAEHGTVESARVIADKFTAQSRGFGFVEMSSGEEAQKAIDALNGNELQGRTLTHARRRDGPASATEAGAAATGGRVEADQVAGKTIHPRTDDPAWRSRSCKGTVTAGPSRNRSGTEAAHHHP